MQRLSLSPSGGKKGWDIRKPASGVSGYIAAGVTALLPGSGIVNNIASNVISTGLSRIEKAVRGKEINWQAEAAKTAASFGEVYHRIFFRRTLARGINSCTRFTVYSARAALPV